MASNEIKKELQGQRMRYLIACERRLRALDDAKAAEDEMNKAGAIIETLQFALGQVEPSPPPQSRSGDEVLQKAGKGGDY